MTDNTKTRLDDLDLGHTDSTMSPADDLSDLELEHMDNMDILPDTGISRHIDSAFSIFSAEKPFGVSNCNQVSLASLPDSVMLKIFSNFTHPELSRIALVCKHWLWVVYDSTLWKFLDLSQKNKVNEKTIINFIQSRLSPLVKSLDLSNCCYSPTIFKELRECENLDTLVLQNFDLKDDEDVSLLVNQNQELCIPESLIRLDIRNVTEGYRFMHVILEGADMSSLECFGFGNKHACTVFTDFQTMFGKMKALRIFECIECETFTDSEINIIADELKMLESLDLKRCTNIHGQSLPYLLESLPRLRSLNLAGTGITDQSIMNTRWELCKLEELDLGFCDYISSVGLIDSLHRMKNLKFIVLHGIGKGKAVCGEALEPIHLEQLWKNMEVISFHFSIRLFQQSFPFLYHCSNLRRLSLRTCNHFSFEFIAASLKHFPNLCALECGSLFASQDSCIKWETILFNIATHCKQMKDIILVKCAQLPISKRFECQQSLSKAFDACVALSNIVLLFTEESVVEVVRASTVNSKSMVNVNTNATFSIIPPFRHSLDSEINQEKFRKYFGY